MTLPLWLLWAVVVALALPALFGSVERQQGSRRLVLARLWSPAVVAVVVAVVVTVDVGRVSEDELYDATDHAARSLSGTLDGGVPDRVEVAVEDELGHSAAAGGPVSGPWSSGATDLEREERYVVEDVEGPGLGGDGEGAAVCLVAKVTTIVDDAGVPTGLTQTWLEVERGRCQE